MPELTTLPQLAQVDLERLPFLVNGDDPDAPAAVKLVTETFSEYERGRASEERRWRDADTLYFGVVEKRKWTGTDVERASLAVRIIYDQIQTAYPIIADALFNYYPTFFDVTPLPGTKPAEAAKVKDLIATYLETPYDETGVSAIPHLKTAVRQAIKYGDGVIELSWDSGLKAPVVEWVDLREFYMDPAATGPLPENSSAVIRRKLMTVEDLIQLRGVSGVKIPTDDQLFTMSHMKFSTTADTAKDATLEARGNTTPVSAFTVDPKHRLVQVLIYWSKDRLIWVLARCFVAINQPNPFGFMPFCKAPFMLVEGRPYSLSLPDVLEDEQRYAQGIRNARLDNLSLILHSPRARRPGISNTPSDRAWGPGVINEVKPEDQEVYKVENVTGDAFREEMMIHQGAAKRMGVNDMAQSGVPTPSNANRNATGVMQQTRSVAQRLWTPVSFFEDYLIVPMLYKMQKMIEKYAPEQLEFVNKSGEEVAVTREEIRRPVKFKMDGASRMLAKDKLAMFLQPISMLVFNEQVMKQANMQGRTIDFAEWERFFQDATSTSQNYSFFRPMSPQEQQQMMQPDPETIAKMQQAQMNAQVRREAMQTKAKSEMMIEEMRQRTAQNESGEKSARELLRLLSDDRVARLKAKLDSDKADAANRTVQGKAILDASVKQRAKESGSKSK